MCPMKLTFLQSNKKCKNERTERELYFNTDSSWLSSSQESLLTDVDFRQNKEGEQRQMNMMCEKNGIIE